MLALHLLQSALVHINTILVQRVLQTRLGRPTNRRRSPRPHRAVLVKHQPIRHVSPRHAATPRPRSRTSARAYLTNVDVDIITADAVDAAFAGSAAFGTAFVERFEPAGVLGA